MPGRAGRQVGKAQQKKMMTKGNILRWHFCAWEYGETKRKTFVEEKRRGALEDESNAKGVQFLSCKR